MEFRRSGCLMHDFRKSLPAALDQMPSSALILFDSDLRMQVARGGLFDGGPGEAGGWEGERIDAVAPPHVVSGLQPHMRDVLRGGVTACETVIDWDPSRTVLMRVSPLHNSGESIIGGLIVGTDITERARLERDLVERNERLVQADSFKDTMIATASHELRTPVTAISSLLELLEAESDLPAATRDLVALGVLSADRLRRLVEDLMLLAEAGNVGLALEITDVQPAQLAALAVAETRIAADAAGVEVSLDARRVAGVRGDPARITQAMDNVISNAIKFTPPGGSVDITVAPTSRGWTFRVSDTGIGIDADEIPGLFAPFVRGRAAMDSVIAGTGLGLSVVREIVDRHGGKVGIVSTPDAGTTVTMEFPLMPPLHHPGP
jgi:signal transduction histidine kinase